MPDRKQLTCMTSLSGVHWLNDFKAGRILEKITTTCREGKAQVRFCTPEQKIERLYRVKKPQRRDKRCSWMVTWSPEVTYRAYSWVKSPALSSPVITEMTSGTHPRRVVTWARFFKAQWVSLWIKSKLSCQYVSEYEADSLPKRL